MVQVSPNAVIELLRGNAVVAIRLNIFELFGIHGSKICKWFIRS